MLSSLNNLFSREKAVLGVDIGTTSIKIVELRKQSQNPMLANYAVLDSLGHFDRSGDVIQANSLKISEKETSSLLSELLKKTNFSTKNAVASIPSFASYTTLIEMPKMSDSETEKAMVFQIQQNIPLPMSQVAVDWVRVGCIENEDGVDNQFILIVAIPNDTITRYKTIFKNVGLTLRAVEVEHLAYTRATIGVDQASSIILDIGARSSNITVVDQGFVKDNNQIDYAGDSLTEAIARGLRIDNRRAEELKKSRGLLGGSGGFELSTLQEPFLDVILNEVNKTKVKFENKFSTKIKRIVLIGGGANLSGIDKYVEKHIKIPSVLGNGLLYVSFSPQISVVAKEIQTRFATSIGVAIKQFIK